jgi:hypothetical protein
MGLGEPRCSSGRGGEGKEILHLPIIQSVASHFTGLDMQICRGRIQQGIIQTGELTGFVHSLPHLI